MNMNKKKENKKILSGLAIYGQLGVSMVMCVVVGFFTGKFLDNFFSTSPVFLIIFIIIGIIASYQTLFKISKKEWTKEE